MRHKRVCSAALLLTGMIFLNCGVEIKSLKHSSNSSMHHEAHNSNGEEYWDERDITSSAPPHSKKPSVKEVKVLYKDDLSPSAFTYAYGGKSAGKSESGFIVCYMDGSDYSGVTYCLGRDNHIDLSMYRDSGTAALAFWAKGGPGVKNVFLGFLDDDSDQRKVQSKLNMGDYGAIDTAWNYYMIPLRRFSDQGMFWDGNRKQEAVSVIDWKRINEIRFSINKKANPLPKDEPAILYVTDMSIIESIPGYVDPVDYWRKFESDEPEVVLHDFETDVNAAWESSAGPESQISFSVVSSSTPKGSSKSLQIEYKLNDWCDVVYDYGRDSRGAKVRDWTKHWGIKFDMYTDKPYQPIHVQVGDAGEELFIASAGGNKGWTEILIPFKDFMKFPYYQPPEAKQNGTFDLKGVSSLDFKPSGEGTSGTFRIDNLRLTNSREAGKREFPERISVTVEGDLTNTVTDRINDGIFGINSVLWDADLILPKTAEYVKEVKHHVIRYPGGLSADEYSWKEVLSKKDPLIDIDEFLEFCSKTGTTPMITVNFGTGTVQDAADWVSYCNIEKKAGVKYWEVGNELYGSWHANHCSAEHYGKRARKYIEAMKAVDPTIQVTVVGVLDGGWNKTVLEHTKDVADGLNVHHYPQNTGEENDAGLLASPQTLDDIIPGVRRQLKEHGVPGKDYQIWLTEWNSVNFDPGPQSLSIVNALFVADYLGMLAVHNIEHASYWNIHNNIFPQGGDYGYLSTRMSDPSLDNIPRPSYWAFLMTSRSLGRGGLHQSATGNDYVTSYLTRHNGKRSLLLVNKYPETTVDAVISIEDFSGLATVQQLTPENADDGPDKRSMRVKKGEKVTLGAYSVTTITLD
ncbi:MAG: carbohydrate binding domain-containing protein [Chitinivibrionales bacterium]